jgi:hypothetical protein
VSLEGTNVRLAFDAVNLVGDLRMGVRLSEAEGPRSERGLAFQVAGADVAVERVRVADAGETAAAGWWSTTVIEGGRVEVEPLRLRAALAARLQDTRPIMEILGERNVVLEWLDSALTVSDVRANAVLEVDPASIRLDGLHVSGDKLEVEGWLELGQGVRNGLVYVAWRGLSAAVEMGPHGREWKLIQSRNWYEERLRSGGGGSGGRAAGRAGG